MKNSCYKKGIVLGIIVLFIGMSSMPLAGSLSFEKQAFQESLPFGYSTSGASGISLIAVIVAGEMGLNDWYVSDVGFNFTNESDDIASVYYRIDNSEWTEYTNPFIISEDGEDICLEWYAVNYEGNQSDVDGPFICSIDQTVPKIMLEYEITGGNPEQGWDLLFTATATDAMSGMNRVEFYLNHELQDTVYGPGPTYTWGFTYHGGLLIAIKVTAYDNAGNSDWEATPGGSNSAFSESSMFRTDINEESSNNYCLDDVLSSEVVERDNHRVTEKSFSGSPEDEVFDPAYVIVVFNKKTGENGGIVDVSIPIFYESDRIDEVYYQLNDGGWTLYNDPVVISEGGVYVFLWYVVDSEGYTSTPESIYFTIDNHPPDRPEIFGPIHGIVGEEYEFEFVTEDPDGDNVSYYIEWEDGTSTGWTNYYGSGWDIVINHTWNKIDDYLLRCKAKDIYEKESEWGYHPIEIPKNRQMTNPIFLQLLERFIDCFPLLEKLLNIQG